ncbi:MAG: biotin transporter BioY [Dethiobacteraceae bacterium]|jgi:biotin transport system substrate-specific component|nr:biotin transporter BioY [Bacillota bacterium]
MTEKFSTRDLVLIAFFAALTSLLAYLVIPLPGGFPPVTGQSLGAMLAGMLLGSRKGAMSQLVYLLLGAVGLPVFAGGTAGVGVIAGHTGGFIWGFVVGAYLTGKLTERKKQSTWLHLAGAAAVGGVLAVYLPGILQMARVLQITPAGALGAMLAYLPGDLLKVLIAAVLARKIRPHLQRLSSLERKDETDVS